MLILSKIEQNKDDYIRLLKIKNFDASDYFKKILELDKERKSLQTKNDDLLAESNMISKQVGILYKNQQVSEAEQLKSRSLEIRELTKNNLEQLQKIQESIQKLLLEVPNIPHPSVKSGKDATDNEIVKQCGKEIESDGMAHWDIATRSGIIDFETGNKISGAGFPVYIDKGAKLQRALINFFLDEATLAGYKEIESPILVNEDSAYATGQLPDKDGQMYFVNEDGFYLIPTAEVPLTNIYRDVILGMDQLPVKLTGYTPCFRREAGSYGKNVRGLNRLHQFDKVEIVQITNPELSYLALDEMVAHVENLISKLGLTFRIVRLCGSDMSFTSALTYDFEVYSSAQKRWLEVSSVSNFESFQSNRMKLRFKDEKGKTQFPHTLNGSALALPRIVAALLENFQDKTGIQIPEVLIPYAHFDRIEL